MQQMGYEFFSRSVFSVNEHPSICRGGKRNLLAQCLHGNGISDHHELLPDLLPKDAVFFLQLMLVQCILND